MLSNIRFVEMAYLAGMSQTPKEEFDAPTLHCYRNRTNFNTQSTL